MSIRFDRPMSHAAHVSRLVAAFALVLTITTMLAHRFGPLATPYMVLFLLIAAALAAFGVILAVTGLVQLWQTGAEGGIPAFKALVYASLPLFLVGFSAVRYETLPKIYDVSTDIIDAPQWLSAPHADQIWLRHDGLITASNRAEQEDAYPALNGRRYEGGMDRVVEAVRLVAKQNGIRIVRTDGAAAGGPDVDQKHVKKQDSTAAVTDAPDFIPVPTPRPLNDEVATLIKGNTDVSLQGEKRTLILGLRFDVLIRLREESETTLVDIRVASRYGPHDLGMSATIAESYLKALDAELLGIAGG